MSARDIDDGMAAVLYGIGGFLGLVSVASFIVGRSTLGWVVFVVSIVVLCAGFIFDMRNRSDGKR